ncbi:MAG: hypothetical protein FVQ80_15185 [Planctomycetes bacterium]|nr:hypothetical protein [Planctomycetota bacterium]
MVIDYPGYLMKEVWEYSAQPGRGRHSIFDGRLAFTLRHYGVKEFATRNAKDFQDFGFSRVWDPLA